MVNLLFAIPISKIKVSSSKSSLSLTFSRLTWKTCSAPPCNKNILYSIWLLKRINIAMKSASVALLLLACVLCTIEFTDSAPVAQNTRAGGYSLTGVIPSFSKAQRTSCTGNRRWNSLVHRCVNFVG